MDPTLALQLAVQGILLGGMSVPGLTVTRSTILGIKPGRGLLALCIQLSEPLFLNFGPGCGAVGGGAVTI